jgi:acetamidase/formamidase
VTRHELVPSRKTATDVFSRAAAPVLDALPGDELVVSTLDAWGHLERPCRPGEGDKLFPDRRGHCLVGPISVQGAVPGTHLAVHLRDVRPGDWGWTSAGVHDTDLNRRTGLAVGSPTSVMWDIDRETLTARSEEGFRASLAPFLGVVGLPPDLPGEHSTIPPRTCGGNLDCRELVAGSTLFLPVSVAGALLSLGDGHAAQGDGEVSGTAIECPMTTELVLDVVERAPVQGAHAVTPAGRMTFGFSESLNDAAAGALDAMLGWIELLFELDRPMAMVVASLAVDLRITQIVNRTFGVHAVFNEGRITVGDDIHRPRVRAGVTGGSHQ